MMHIEIVATPDEYQQWLEQVEPDTWRDWLWQAQPFNTSDQDGDPIALFLHSAFGLFGHADLSEDREHPSIWFHQCENQDYAALTLRLPDWMLPLVCRYHADNRKISKEQALADFAEAVKAYPEIQELLLARRVEVTPLLP